MKYSIYLFMQINQPIGGAWLRWQCKTEIIIASSYAILESEEATARSSRFLATLSAVLLSWRFSWGFWLVQRFRNSYRKLWWFLEEKTRFSPSNQMRNKCNRVYSRPAIFSPPVKKSKNLIFEPGILRPIFFIFQFFYQILRLYQSTGTFINVKKISANVIRYSQK